MNRNGQGRFFDHAVRLRSEPHRAAEFQQEIDAIRRKMISDALVCRPIFLPFEFTMAAAGQVSPYRDTTPNLNYDVIITGAKSDTQTRDIIIRHTETERSMVSVGNESTLYLRTDEFAGQIPGNGGQTGPFYFPRPILIEAGNRMTLEMFKTDTTDDDEEANVVLIGSRVFPKAFGDTVLLNSVERAAIDRAITLREIPATHWLKVVFSFDSAIAGGEARNIFTPRQDEPRLLLGMRTSLRYSEIEIGLQGEPSWTVNPTASWAIAAEDEIGHDNWQWFSKPVYLPKDSTVEIRRVVNGMYSTDTSLIDTETGNTITFITSSV